LPTCLLGLIHLALGLIRLTLPFWANSWKIPPKHIDQVKILNIKLTRALGNNALFFSVKNIYDKSLFLDKRALVKHYGCI
jgi:hypothetical protein